MKLSVLQENFLKATSFAFRFASPKAQLPVLGNILLRATKTKLEVAATNLETSISIQIGAKVANEGEITIPGKIITELVSNLPLGPVEIESEKEQLTIACGSFSSSVLGMNSSDFPSIPTTIDKKTSITLPREEFIKSISSVIFATSIDETRPLLTGVLFLFEKEKLTLVATDGFRLSKKEIKLEKGSKDFRVILPRGILLELSKLEEELLLNFFEKENQVLFGAGDTVLASRILEGVYPDFEKIIPKNYLYKIILDKEELLRAVKLASIFARDSGNVVKISLGEDFIDIFAESQSAGSQKGRVDAKIEKKDKKNFEIAFNFRFLEELLGAISGEEVEIEFSGEGAPGVFKDPKDPSFLHLIMPVKIQD